MFSVLVKAGIPMLEALNIASGIIDNVYIKQKVVKIYKDRFSYIVDNIATLIEPILLGAIAGFVLVLALGIFLPMWNMVDMAN